MLAGREYTNLLTQKDPSRFTVSKIRRSFVWEDNSYQLDEWKHPHPDLVLLEMYCSSDKEEEDVVTPPFLEVVREVTKDVSYSMFNLAEKPQAFTPDSVNCHTSHDR